jgi:hypothetical protein
MDIDDRLYVGAALPPVPKADVPFTRAAAGGRALEKWRPIIAVANIEVE